jgi:diguanylate cyclase (GGDEF)-like protein
MTTAKRLQLMLTITVLFGLSSMFSIVQLSKATQFHHLNFLYITNVSELQEELNNYPGIPLNTERIKNKLENVRNLPVQCLTLINGFDRFIMKMIGADDAVSLCQNDKLLAEQMLEELYDYKSPTISNQILIESLIYSTGVFSRNSEQLEKPVEKIGSFTTHMAFWLIIPFSFFVIFFSIYIFRKIKIKTAHLQDAITALEISEEEKKILAYYDALTALPNRNLFTEILEHEIHQVKRYKNSFALLYIDLDRFKFINDTLGHDAGDELLIQVSKRLKRCTRESDTLARFGGDEFLLILSGPNSEKNAKIVAEKIIISISKPFILDGHEMHISASVGITFCPKNGHDSSILLKRADIAMYEAKANGKNQYHAYEEDSINHKTDHRLTLEKDLRRSIENDELRVHYQPIINLANQNTVGVEALLRWQHNNKGMIAPLEFISIAEETGMIKDIGEWVIRQACKQCKQWRTTNRLGFHVAVNVSAYQLTDDSLPKFINDTLSYYSLPPDALDIEITESIFYAENKNIGENINQLNEIGMRLLLDDFGTGYSSLSTLHGLPFDIIKIDRSFMDSHHPRKRIMTQTIIDMAKNFGMKTVAEGVEDQDTVDFLRGHGCDYAQGFYYQRPVAADDLDVIKNYGEIITPSNVVPISNKK